MNRKNVIYVVLIIIVIGIYYYYKDDEDVSVHSRFTLPNQPIYESDSMVTNIYNLGGNITYKITSKSVKHFDDSNDTKFEQPRVTVYDSSNFDAWHIQAEQATLDANKLLYLYRDVQLDNLTKNAQLQKITTDNAVVDLTTQMVRSKDPVVIKGMGLYSTGVGLVGNLKAKKAAILDDVKTYYSSGR